MNYWIYITSFNNWLITKEKNILGVAQTYDTALKSMNVSDKCLIYTKSGKYLDSKIISSLVAVYEIKSDPYFDDSSIFSPMKINPNEKFPLRREISPLTIFGKPRPFKKFVNQLNFIKNKKRWGLTFMGKAIIKIPVEDFTILTYDE